MPGVIFFIGALCAAIFFELEVKPSNSREFLKFRRVRSSWAFMLLIFTTAVLAGTELFLVSQGKLYQTGIPISGLLKLLLLIAIVTAIYFFNKKSTSIGPRKKTIRVVVGILAITFALINLMGVFECLTHPKQLPHH